MSQRTTFGGVRPAHGCTLVSPCQCRQQGKDNACWPISANTGLEEAGEGQEGGRREAFGGLVSRWLGRAVGQLAGVRRGV